MLLPYLGKRQPSKQGEHGGKEGDKGEIRVSRYANYVNTSHVEILRRYLRYDEEGGRERLEPTKARKNHVVPLGVQRDWRRLHCTV